MDTDTPEAGPGGGVLAGQVAVVTGGGRGLGRTIACRLASRGVRVAVAARTSSEVAATVAAIESNGGVGSAFALDVADQAAVNAMVAEVERRYGPVDLLVNDAAVVTPFGPSWEVAADQWWRSLQTNLYGPFLCAHAVLPGMTGRGHGRIVNLVSAAGLNAIPYASAYVTSKAAMIRLSEALAVEAGEHGVTVFALDPGWVSTAMTDYAAHSEAGRRWMPWAAAVFGTEAHVPAERAAELVVELASGRADRLTGRYLQVADDLQDLVSRAEEIRANDLQSMRLRTET